MSEVTPLLAQNLGYMTKHRNYAMSLDEAFAVIEQAAITGARCPVTSGPKATPGLYHRHLMELARLGRIRFDISAHNWRQVFILTGPHTGACTAPNPIKSVRAYRAIDKSTRRITWHKAGDDGHVAQVDNMPSLSAEYLREERLHGYAARDLTGAVMGDPPVGFSALDRMRG